MKNKIIETNKIEDVIDLVGILKLLIKNIKLILITAVIITILSGVLALYKKHVTPNRVNQNFILRKYDIVPNNLNFSVNSVLLNNNFIDAIYNNRYFKQYMKDKNIKTIESYRAKRTFLTSKIKIRGNSKKYIIQTNFIKNNELSIQMINLYLDLLNNEFRKYAIKKIGKINYIDIKLNSSEDKLNIISTKINKYVSSLPPLTIQYQPVDRLLSVIMPMTLSNKDIENSLYNKYYNKLLLLKQVNNPEENIIIKTSSIYEPVEKGILIKMVVLGMILGLFLGTLLVFLKKFIESTDWKE